MLHQFLLGEIKSGGVVHQCGLLHGTEYLAQARIRYKESPWSEWSSSQSGVTLESSRSIHNDTITL